MLADDSNPFDSTPPPPPPPYRPLLFPQSGEVRAAARTPLAGKGFQLSRLRDPLRRARSRRPAHHQQVRPRDREGAEAGRESVFVHGKLPQPRSVFEMFSFLVRM